MNAPKDPNGLVPARIAIIGMACRLPGADDPEQFWVNLREGVESLTRYSPEQLAERGVDREVIENPAYVPASGEPSDVPGFDAAFFGYSAREAQLMDPQHRYFLECATSALQDAGCDPQRYPGLIGVFAGSSMNAYLPLNLMSRPEITGMFGDQQIMLGNDKEFLPLRASYKLGLTGPSVAIQASCSTSLTAVHFACQSILSGECDVALAGGASLRLPHGVGYLYQEGGTFSPDGHVRTFDARAGGTVAGSGVGVVVLKHLDDAVRDGDNVYAVIQGTAVSNDGSGKASFTAPSVEGQARAIASALASAGWGPSDVDYVECHGTGTRLGDPIEVAAITRALGAKAGTTYVGSVKPNIGHLDAAAGVASLIKTVQALSNAQIPPTLHYQTPNPEIDFATAGLRVAARLRDWPASERPRRASVNSLGMGGTNAHVAVEQPPAPRPSTTDAGRRPVVLALSAATGSALDTHTRAVGQWLAMYPESRLPDVAWTLLERTPLPLRRAFVVRDRRDAVYALTAHSSTRAHDGRVGDRAGVAMVFPGQGTQRLGMLSDLYEDSQSARACVDEGLAHLPEETRQLVRELVLGEGAVELDVRRTDVAQPALFLAEVVVARELLAAGVKVAAVIGHSIGELSAACIAEVFDLENGIRLASERGRLVALCEPGAMLAVAAPPAEVERFLGGDVEISAVNAHDRITLAGPATAIAALEDTLREAGLAVAALSVSHAFHTEAMVPAVRAFLDVAAATSFSPPMIPIVSTRTGRVLQPEEVMSPEHWAEQLRAPVRFADAVDNLAASIAPGWVVECGPGSTLTSLVRRASDDWSCVATEAAAATGSGLMELVAELWVHGCTISSRGAAAEDDLRKVSLPTYPFERQRYWIDAAPRGGVTSSLHQVPTPLPPQPPEPVDARRQLANLHPRPALQTAFASAAAGMETHVASVWSEMLGFERVGTGDSFFELGGDSLLAMQLVDRLRVDFSVDLPVAALFDSPTVAGVTATLQELLGTREFTIPAARSAAPVSSTAPGTSHPASDPDGPGTVNDSEFERLMQELDSASVEEQQRILAQLESLND